MTNIRTLVFDTETTGMVDWKHLNDHTKQPYIVQIAAVLYDGRAPVAQMSVIVTPRRDSGQSVPIPEVVSAIHGITNERAEHVGLPRGIALRMFSALILRADRIVAHNMSFDQTMLEAEWKRDPSAIPPLWDKIPRICTMRAAAPVCKIPGLYGIKWPKLIEAHQHFLGCGFEGAHDALADVQACARVLWALEDGGHIKPDPKTDLCEEAVVNMRVEIEEEKRAGR
jgi:DNA polymerase III epsilon subunit-like protein